MSTEERLTNGSTISIFSPQNAASTKYVLYFHGGGLIYGSRNDLPIALRKLFLNQGYTVITLDYLLAPNSPLVDISAALYETFKEINNRYIKHSPFIFCGRSAGGYLMLLLTKKIMTTQEQLPEKLINFYGYFNLDFIENQKDNGHPAIPEEAIHNLPITEPIWDDPQLQRSLLYIYGIQHKKLYEYYGVEKEDQTNFSLTENEISALPPIFSTASTSDQEVPFKYSKQLAKKNKAGVFTPVYFLEHDFLNHTEDEQTQDVLKKLDDWL